MKSFYFSSAYLDYNNHDGLRHTYSSFFVVPFLTSAAISAIFPFLCFLVALASIILCFLLIQRRRTYLKLSSGKCNLPTVLWRPRFLNYEYAPSNNDKNNDAFQNNGNNGSKCQMNKEKLPSSNITNILPRMERLNGPYGMYATVYGWKTRVIHMAHPLPVRAVLDVSRKDPGYDHFENMFGEGVFTAYAGEGGTWRAKRASVVHALMKGFGGSHSNDSEKSKLIIEANRAAEEFGTLLQNTMDSNKVEMQDNANHDDNFETNSLNVVPILQRCTIGFIYRYLTHHDVELYPSHKNTPLVTNSQQSKSQQHNPSQLLDAYLQAITTMRMLILAQARSIWFLLPRWIYKLFSPMYRTEIKTMKHINAFAQCAIRNAQSGSPLHFLINRKSHGNSDVKNNQINYNENDNKYKIPKEMMDEAITLLFAGQDTGAATLSWTLHLLSLHPEIQNNMVKEICSIYKQEIQSKSQQQEKNNSSSDNILITRQMIGKMTYLDAVLKESMRLYPVAPFVVRKLTQDLSLPPDKRQNVATQSKDPISAQRNIQSTTIPKDSLACVWIYGLHRNPQLWHKPNDFLPQRWLDPKLKELDRNAQHLGSPSSTSNGSAYIPFATGPRNCIGQSLAHVMLRIILTKLVLSYEFIDHRLLDVFGKNDYSRGSSFRKDMQAGFTVLPSGGVWLSLRRRPKEE
eukprot:CAMPEP_0184861916 /NCGR_PEP_ID=MMETSP0580-20130426/6497_1 /TAXON_ID=1118495 /ORGANISM="Dactyliosolen fragilissimus" /LENGTH=684 /DNA_ID=CAMNT_0027359593 /DNA_START=231 /DNA_END=2285 /DNA_ORIENTATION=-